MLKNTPRKRAPMKQLHDVSKKIHDLLVQKGVSRNENVLEEIAGKAGGPLLPGLPQYLPHKFTIEVSRQAMYLIIKDWIQLHEGDEAAQEKVHDFFAFVIKRIKFENKKFKQQKTGLEVLDKMNTVPAINTVFSSAQKMKAAMGLQKFFVDSFAIFIIVNNGGSTTDYTEWFLGEWTPELYRLWVKKEDRETNGKKKI